MRTTSYSKIGGVVVDILHGHVPTICGVLVAFSGREKNSLRVPMRIVKKTALNMREL
jgi:hypothetical protein